MASTYELIASNTVGSGGVASVTFSSIPSTYTDLALKVSVRTDRTGANTDNVRVRLNGDTSSSYTVRALLASDSTVGNDLNTTTSGVFGYYTNTNNTTSSTFSSCELYIPNYTSSNYKSISNESSANGTGSGYNSMTANLWANTAAITTILMYPQVASNFVEYSTFYLYGIKNS
jgi:hypothetical protein